MNARISPYRRGADDGLIFGLYLTLMFFGSIFAPKLPLLGLLSFALMAGVPAIIALFLYRYNRNQHGCASFSELWMSGIVTFICGSFISGALLIVYMKWIEPDFIVNQLNGLIEASKQVPGTALEEAGNMASQMIDANFIPSATAIASEVIMLAIVSGSLLSMIISSLLVIMNRNKRGKTPPPQQ